MAASAESHGSTHRRGLLLIGLPLALMATLVVGYGVLLLHWRSELHMVVETGKRVTAFERLMELPFGRRIALGWVGRGFARNRNYAAGFLIGDRERLLIGVDIDDLLRVLGPPDGRLGAAHVWRVRAGDALEYPRDLIVDEEGGLIRASRLEPSVEQER